MSVNLELNLTISGLADQAQADRLLEAMNTLLREYGVDGDLMLWVEQGASTGPSIVGGTPYPLIISRSYEWRPAFEAAVEGLVEKVAPPAEVEFAWSWPDEEDADA
jgi:hypothetical protein